MTPTTTTPTTYSTTDFYTAAFLLSTGNVRLVETVWQGRRAEFKFETMGGMDIRAALSGFRDGSALVSARDFVDAIAALKRELYAPR